LILSFTPARIALAMYAGVAFQMSAQTTPAPPVKTQPAPRRGFAGAGGDYKIYPPETLESGQKIYTANCAFCHGGSAKGGESGPDLLRSVIILHDENGEILGAFIHVGRPDKGMPKFNLPDDQVRDVAAFLHDRVRAAAERSTYKILDIVVGNAKAGEEYFNGAGKCATCHSVDKDLAHVASKYGPVDLQQKIVMPREGRSRGGPGAAITVKVTQPSGDVSEGPLIHIDDFAVVLEQDGKRQTIQRQSADVPKVELHDPLQGHIDLLHQYTDSDIHNLTAYLVTLK
jgi:mono/diheme cytochrome c family protein